MPEHDVAPLGEIHIPYNWSYANAAARTGATGFIASDVGKFARQTDDNSIWMLTATTPTWAQVGGPGGAPGLHASTHVIGGSDPISQNATFNDQTGTTYTIQASDNGKVITCNNASAITVTVPSGLGAGFNCMVIQKGAGQVTFSPSSTTINNRQSHTKIAGQYGVATLVAYVANTFVLAGDTAA